MGTRRFAPIIRDFLAAEGRILIDPQGRLEVGGGVPRAFAFGAAADAQACIRAGRAYFAAEGDPHAQRVIRRTVGIVGRRTENGWIVLERRNGGR